MHSLTYTQKSCGRMPAAEMHMFICVHFLPHANPSRQSQRAESKKECIHYIYTKYPFFIFKKCIHYIYTRNHISSRQQYFQRPSHYSPTPQICRQQAEIYQTTTLPPHILQAYTTQQSQATTMQPLQYIKKRYILSRRRVHIFSPTSRFLQNGKHGTSNGRRKKRERGRKGC